jgi:hypothetical protein
MPVELTATQLDLTHAERLRQVIPRSRPSRPAGQRPWVILIGGQPAIGKSRLQSELYAAHSLAFYDGDDNALVNPQYDAIMIEDPLHAGAAGAGASDGCKHVTCLRIGACR